MNNNQIKKTPVGISLNKETYEACAECRTETLIGSLNLSNGECGACYKPKRKYTDKQLRELIKLDKGFEDEII